MPPDLSHSMLMQWLDAMMRDEEWERARLRVKLDAALWVCRQVQRHGQGFLADWAGQVVQGEDPRSVHA